ncbi:ATP-dependent dethiobiotin synthetase BioD [Pleurocapsa sp. CCALA 161]|uniref:dethiobiotin synthase n=1 Tax=Pleurocapsa sp. CCALA 161 TaxID=2107688 RepID=UPI000D06A85C|nr:dethiobiotin synthase [Pleurocapsa sp. CCALA 161]PSB09732.1 ATP-dependent dethiobiotin synthetase BioD [Pleurocapsa sp. CCALA 161]
MTTLLIAGTDTDVGKTFVTIALTVYWQKYRLNQDNNGQNLLSIFKLMQTGVGDVELYQRLFADVAGIEIVPPLRFEAALAPPIAAAKEGRKINLKEVWEKFSIAEQKSQLVLLESLGGLGSPVTEELTVGDIAGDWRLPTVLVVPVKLGAIAHSVANVALARSLKIDLRGIILNCSQLEAVGRTEDLTPIGLIQSLTNVPVIGTLPYAKDWDNSDRIAQKVANWDLELILPKQEVYL